MLNLFHTYIRFTLQYSNAALLIIEQYWPLNAFHVWRERKEYKSLFRIWYHHLHYTSKISYRSVVSIFRFHNQFANRFFRIYSVYLTNLRYSSLLCLPFSTHTSYLSVKKNWHVVMLTMHTFCLCTLFP